MAVPKAIAALLKKAKKKGKDVLTPKQLKEERKKVAAEKRRKAAAEKKKNIEAAKDMKLGVSEQGTKTRITQGKKASDAVEKKVDKAVGSRIDAIKSGAKISGAGALTTAGIMNKDKIMKALENETDKKAQQKEADKKKADERADTALSGFSKKLKERSDARKKRAAEDSANKKADAKKKKASSKVKTSLFGKVTGKGPKDRNVTVSEGKKLANVTREQLTKLGLDPDKKGDLRKYLNAFDRMGTRPTKKSDLVAGKNMGGMMKKEGYSEGGTVQGKNDRLDESLGARRGKESTKSQSYKSRRNESRGSTKKKSMGVATRGGGAIIK